MLFKYSTPVLNLLYIKDKVLPFSGDGILVIWNWSPWGNLLPVFFSLVCYLVEPTCLGYYCFLFLLHNFVIINVLCSFVLYVSVKYLSYVLRNSDVVYSCELRFMKMALLVTYCTY